MFILKSVHLHLKNFPRRTDEKLLMLVMFRERKSRKRDARGGFHFHFYIFRHYSSF